jgi:hypothetical protein
MIRRTAAATAVSAPFITSTSFEFACACAFLALLSLLTAGFAQVMTS